MRGRAWRIYKQECKILKRLAYQANLFRSVDKNDISYDEVSIRHLIGSPTHFMYKSCTTSRDSSRYKTKYSPNGKSYYRDDSRKGKRETDKVKFFKMLKEYGLK